MQWPHCVCDSQHLSDMSAVNTLTTLYILYYSESCQLLHSIYTILGICSVGWGLVLNEAMETID